MPRRDDHCRSESWVVKFTRKCKIASEMFISYGNFQCLELVPHKNRGLELTYVEEGLMEWMVEGHPENVGAGSVFFTLPWQAHGSPYEREPKNTIWHLLFSLREDYSTTPTLRNLLKSLIRELQSQRDFRNFMAISLLRAALVELKRIVAGEVANLEMESQSHSLVQELISELSSQCDKDWSLELMAEKCGVRRSQLCKIFQQLTGTTPNKYLFRVRIENAKTLLLSSDLKVTDIAFECGYSSSQYFANSFKRAVGMMPSEYRRSGERLTQAVSMDWGRIQFRSKSEELRRVKVFSDLKN